MVRHASEKVLRSRRLTFQPHQHAEKQTDVRPIRPDGLWNLGDPANYGGHLALFEDLGASGHDDVECVVPVPGSKQVFEAGTHLPSLEVPGRSLVQQTGFDSGPLCFELEAKHVPKEMVEAKPPA